MRPAEAVPRAEVPTGSKHDTHEHMDGVTVAVRSLQHSAPVCGAGLSHLPSLSHHPPHHEDTPPRLWTLFQRYEAGRGRV